MSDTHEERRVQKEQREDAAHYANHRSIDATGPLDRAIAHVRMGPPYSQEALEDTLTQTRDRIIELEAEAARLQTALDAALKAQACAEDSAGYEAKRAARLRGLLDAVREGCRARRWSRSTTTGVRGVALTCTHEGSGVLDIILRGEVGKRGE